jgi:putative heme iron utilization protein
MSANVDGLVVRARTLVREGRHAVLSTLAEDGTPFGSLVAYAFDDELRPYLFVSRLAEHTKNLVRDARASLLVQDTRDGDPLAGARDTLIGTDRKSVV